MSEESTATAATHPLTGVAAEPGVAKPDPILIAEDVRKSFGGLVAVDVDHLEIQRGIITGLIGPNGAGKTTFFNLVTGFDRPDRGSWTFNGEKVAGLPSFKVARKGMVRTFQLTKTLAKMPVIDNMKLAATEQRGERFFASLWSGIWRNQEKAIEARADELLKRFQLYEKREEYAATLSGGQRKLLEMARALMVDPDLIMLDEPMAGVNPALVQKLLEHVKQLCDEGKTVVFIEHNMDIVMGISDWVVCMAEGQIIAEGPPESIGKNSAVIDAYLGAQHDEPVEEART